MKNIFNYRFISTLLIILFSIFLIIFSVLNINLDASISSLFPNDENLRRSAGLSSLSSMSDKVILFVEVDDENDLEPMILKFQELIDKSSLAFKNALLSGDDINELMQFAERNSLLLYPYETLANPFTASEVKRRLDVKKDYLLSLPFINPGESFFLDPLMMGAEVLKSANENKQGKYFPQFGGVVSQNKKAYIKILNSCFTCEEYESTKKLKELDNEIVALSKELKCDAFLYSSHLFFLESRNRIIFDISVIFILTIVLVLFIFYFFFRKISLLVFSFMPIIAGFALTFLSIALLKKSFGAIAFAAGATNSGIAIDYTIHYLTKRSLYTSVKEIRSKIGFSLILGFITTLVSFIFLPFSGITSLQEIALFGVLTISFAFLFSWFVLQNLLPPDKYKSNVRSLNFPIFHKKAFLIWGGVMIFFILFLPFLKFEDNIFNLDMKHKELKNRLEQIQSHFLESSDSIFLSFTGDTKDEILDKSFRALQAVREKSPDLAFFTPSIFMPSSNLISSRKDFVKNNFNKGAFLNAISTSAFTGDTFNTWLLNIRQIDNANITGMPEFLEEEIDSMFVKWKGDDYILIPMYKRDVAAKIKTILTDENIDFYMIDVLNDSADGIVTFEKKALVLLLLSMVIIFIILLIAYKNIIHALCSVLPSTAALISCLALTIITGRPFNMMHLVASILLLGIGVDYGIFITSAFRDNYSLKELQMTYQSIFISALTTLAAFGVLIVSANYSIFSLGSSMFVGIAVSFLTAYLALPYIITRKK